MNKPIPDQLELKEELKEEQYVHQVYEEISSHFSNTRYKPWPVVENFITGLDVGSIGADAGCGNGKYMGLRKGEIFITGSDITKGLVEIANSKGHDCMVSDCLKLPYRNNSLDFAISIAVIHHFSSEQRRLDAINELIRVVRPGGKILIFVWALEQKATLQDNNITTITEIDDSKVQETVDVKPVVENTNQKVYYRYYHLFKEGELDDVIKKSGRANILESGYDRDNWYAVIQVN
ncbi:hypothetical protein BB558_003966 [Smittium angustum]|uniref:Methyltransferase type 11 domain-containing protein n=1 Tax=Smittium angustum TaxID=133377 RepID=A0A2U1J4I2_SMIAN|nr:hypothetical protein BB558_003966 [Smittium angustum]